MKKLNTSTILLILALLIFAGCSSTPITPIKKDSPAPPKDESCILLVRIKVKNHSGFFLEKFFDVHPKISINKIEYDKKDSHIFFTHSSLYSGTEKETQETWKAENGLYTLEQAFNTKAECGEYLLNDLNLYLGSTTSYGYNSKTTTSYTHHFYLNQGFSLSERGVYVLGTIYFDILEFSGTFPDYSFKYNLYLEQKSEDIENIIKEFQTGYPKIASALEKEIRILPVHYKYICSFSEGSSGHKQTDLWPSIPYRDQSDKSNTMEYLYWKGKYALKKKVSDTLFNYIGMNRRLALSSNYDIEWKSRINWSKPGEESKGFGLMFGDDPKNCYFFTTTGKGQTAVAFLQKDAWQNRVLGFNGKNWHYYSEGQENYHRIENRDGVLKYYVNDKLLCEFKSVFAIQNPYFGFFISGEGLITYDDFIITGKDQNDILSAED